MTRGIYLLSVLFCSSAFVFGQKKDSLVRKLRTDTLLYTVHFDKDEYDLTSNETAKLDSFVIKYWNLPKIEVFITGHTDTDGSEEYNQVLSKNRCKAVLSRINELEINPFDSLRLDAFGERRLLKAERSKSDQAQNRRVELTIIYRTWYDTWIPCAGVRHCSKKIELPQGTVYWVDTCATPNYKECFKITEYIDPDSVRAAGLHTMDNEGNTLVSGGMLKYDICDGLMKHVHIPVNENCDTPEMDLYKQDEDGNWELIEGMEPEVTEIDGRKYYTFPITGSGMINCDARFELPPRQPKIIFKGKRGLKLDEVRISCDCPLMIQTASPKRANRKKVKLDRQCCPELQVSIKATSKTGETLELEYGPINRLKARKSPFACKEEEVWRWFIFRKRHKPVYRFYRVREKDIK